MTGKNEEEKKFILFREENIWKESLRDFDGKRGFVLWFYWNTGAVNIGSTQYKSIIQRSFYYSEIP